MKFLRKLNGQKHNLISSVCISKNGSMVWNYTDKAFLTMKKMTENELKSYLSKITDEALFLIMFIKLKEKEENYFLK